MGLWHDARARTTMSLEGSNAQRRRLSREWREKDQRASSKLTSVAVGASRRFLILEGRSFLPGEASSSAAPSVVVLVCESTPCFGGCEWAVCWASCLLGVGPLNLRKSGAVIETFVGRSLENVENIVVVRGQWRRDQAVACKTLKLTSSVGGLSTRTGH